MTRQKGPVVLHVAVPLSILLSGAILAFVYGSRKIPKLLEETARGVLPSGFEVKLPEERKYILWIHSKGSFAGKEYQSAGEVPPGAKIFVFDRASARQLAIKPDDSLKRHGNGESALSFGSFQAERPGEIIEVKSTGLKMPLLITLTAYSPGEVMRILLTISGLFISFLIAAFFAYRFLKSGNGRRSLESDS